MIAPNLTTRPEIGTYSDGRPYSPAQGRYAPRKPVEDRLIDAGFAVIDLFQEQPTPGDFLRRIVQELKTRYYRRTTIKSYTSVLRSFLRWFGGLPHQITREDVRQYLELLVDGGLSSYWVSVNLSAIRTAFDKMCGRQITLGLLSPRRPKRLPIVLNESEVLRLLEAAPSLRDKLLLGLMYATGLRVSEIVRLRWWDLDFERQTIFVWQGKGRSDRVVMLPESYRPLLRELAAQFSAEDFVFPGDQKGRHVSPRTVQRVMKRALAIAGIGKAAGPHSLRHSFAAHLIEHGTNVRFVQKLLGHKNLRTTTIYTRVAVVREQRVQSPLDTLTGKQADSHVPQPEPSRPVGRMKIDLRPRKGEKAADVKLTILNDDCSVHLEGIVVRETRPGWITMELPPLEHWESALEQLPSQQRARIETSAFYSHLQTHVSRRFLAQNVGAY